MINQISKNESEEDYENLWFLYINQKNKMHRMAKVIKESAEEVNDWSGKAGSESLRDRMIIIRDKLKYEVK